MALRLTRRGTLGPGDDGSGDAAPAKPNVVPFEKPKVEFVDDEKPRGGVSVNVGDDGIIEISVGSDEPEQQSAAGSDDFDCNLALDLDENALASLAQWLIEGVDADLEARRQWEDTANLAAYYLGIELRDPVSQPASDGTVSQGVVTAMLEVQAKSWGVARAELLPVAGPVKVERIAIPKVPGAPPDQAVDPSQDPISPTDEASDEIADALERDMNWYLTKGDRGYYPDTSKMLWHRSLIGLAFKEVYRCPIQRKPISRWTMAQDLIVSGDPAHLSEAKRVTKRVKIDQGLMRRYMKTGYYRDIVLAQATGRTSATEIVIGEVQGTAPTPSLPRDFDHEIYESSCNIGSGTNYSLAGSLALLDKDENGDDPGYPLPYRIAIDVDSRTVLSIRRNWKEGDEDHLPRKRFVKYGFLPGFGFYDLGLIHIVGNPTQAATMIQRSLVDAGLFANFPAWAIKQGAGARLENTVFRPGPGEVVKIPSTGQTKISDDLMAWPYKEPSASSMAMGQKLEGDIRKLGGVIDIPVGEGRIGNTPVGTIMSYIEAISQVPGAIHKDDHIAQQEEFEMLRELIAEEPEVLTRGNKSPARKWQIAEELLSPDLIPRADPNTPSQIHRLTKIQGLVTLGGLPQFAMGDKDGQYVNNRAIYRSAVEVLSGGDAEQFTFPPNPPTPQTPPPDPRVIAAQINAQSKAAQTAGQLQGKQIDAQTKETDAAMDAQQREADRESEETRAAMTLAGKRDEAATSSAHQSLDRTHEAVQAGLDRAHETAQTERQAALSPPLTGGLTSNANETPPSSGGLP